MQLNEDFLHYIWQYRLFKRLDVYCKDGQPLQIIHPGVKNTDAGPDFTLAKLRIGPQLWAGNVEIHLKSSDWQLHGHQKDKSYDTVVLHAVYEDDIEIRRTDGTLIPILILKELVPESLLNNYLQLIGGRNFFPCSNQIKDVDQLRIDEMLEKMIKKRLAGRAADVYDKMQQNNNNWNETYYYLLMRNFGFKVNAVPFELLADAVPSTLIGRYSDQPLQVAALLFGVAGFLERDFKDDYPRQLKSAFVFLQKKYQLKSIDVSLWKFMRIHPQNFPVWRIAQAASLLAGTKHSLSKILENPDLKEIKEMFSVYAAHAYWNNHSDFDRECKEGSTRLGKHSIENIVINTVSLILYTYGQYSGRPQFIERAFTLLKTIPSERNAILLNYQQAGMKLRHAYDSQAVLELNKKFCSQKKCLNCIIGIDLLGNRKSL